MTETMHSIRKKYRNHKSNAKKRFVPFLLTFDEWYKIWQDSGHWSDRGNKKGQYVMSRKGDIGPYSVDNVYINTHADNIREAWKGKARGPQSIEHIEKVNAYKIGKKQSDETIRKRVINTMMTKQQSVIPL